MPCKNWNVKMKSCSSISHRLHPLLDSMGVIHKESSRGLSLRLQSKSYINITLHFAITAPTLDIIPTCTVCLFKTRTYFLTFQFMFRLYQTGFSNIFFYRKRDVRIKDKWSIWIMKQCGWIASSTQESRDSPGKSFYSDEAKTSHTWHLERWWRISETAEK